MYVRHTTAHALALFAAAAQLALTTRAACGVAHGRCRDNANGGGVRARALFAASEAEGAANTAYRVAWCAAHEAYRCGGPPGSADLFEMLTCGEAPADPGTLGGIIDALFAAPVAPTQPL